MINVVCFCGFAYSFADDAGACPQCGEQVSFTHASNTDPQEVGDRLDYVLNQSAKDSPPEELAA